jgi:light-regulated signal transduction histidine kinase (bacteriophytochrome)
MRAACEFLGSLTSLQIAALDDRELLAQRTARRATEDALTKAMRASTAEHSVLEELLAHPTELMALVGADGAAVVCGADVVTCGRTPPPALIRDIATWVDDEEALRPFSTPSLGAIFARAREVSAVASGLLTFALPGVPPMRLLWFRPEIIHTVTWGGDPAKPVAADSGQRLHPRHSFALWREEVKLRARPWTASDLEAADELQHCAVEVDLERRLSSEQHAVQARDELIAVVSHDLRNPLGTVTLGATMLLAKFGDDPINVEVGIGVNRFVLECGGRGQSPRLQSGEFQDCFNRLA